MKTAQSMIAVLMEDTPYSAGLMGSSSMVDTPSITLSMNPLAGNISNDTESNTYEQDGCDQEFTKEHLLAAKDFIECVGGIDQARKLIDKCDECIECLDFLDDEQNAEDDIMSVASDTVEYL
jgi:hypothetical protein